MIEVEPYTLVSPSTRAQLPGVFARASEGSPGGALWGDLASEAAVYLNPYIELEPASLLLAIDDGCLVGYLAGCVNSATFPSEESRIDAAIRQYKLFQRSSTRPFFLRALRDGFGDWIRRRPTVEDFADLRWPSHLHIDLIPSARGTGAADALMTAWRERLIAAESLGCHLQTQVENTRARRFFARHGFVDHGAPVLIPGVRAARTRVHQQTMVSSLTPAPNESRGEPT